MTMVFSSGAVKFLRFNKAKTNFGPIGRVFTFFPLNFLKKNCVTIYFINYYTYIGPNVFITFYPTWPDWPNSNFFNIKLLKRICE